MNPSNISFASLSKLATLRQQQLSSSEIIGHFLQRIQLLNDKSKAFISVSDEPARLAAEACDQTTDSPSTLYGLPYAVKDLINVAGEITTGGSQVLANNRVNEDAFLIARMRAGGAICLGKNNLHEFAYGATGENDLYGTAVNAYDTTRLAGGSSSGSAAAVAFGMVPAAFGTDTGGSVRAPAALCGLVGFKPTIGRISTRGVIPYSWSLDHVGTITRTVKDAALLLQTTAGYDPADPGCANTPCANYLDACHGSMAELRVGLPRTFYFERADPEILAATENVIRFLEKSGAKLVDIDMPDMTYCRTVSLTVQMPEALSFHMPYLNKHGDRYSADFRAGLALGQCILAEHYVRTKRMMARYRQQTAAQFENVDVILTPATPIIAPKVGTVNVTIDGIDEAVGNAITRYTTFFNMTGHPAITLPCGMHSAGLPMGVQIIGRYFDETTVLQVASAMSDVFNIPPPIID